VVVIKVSLYSSLGRPCSISGGGGH